MKLAVVSSILLTSAYGSVWAYRETLATKLSTNATESLQEVKETKDIATMIIAPSSDPILVKGASAGPVILIAPTDDSTLATTDPIDETVSSKEKGETSGGGGGGGGVVVTIGDLGTPGSIKVLETNETNVSGSSIGSLVSSSAVIGPSIGTVIVTGPKAPPTILVTPKKLSDENRESIDSLTEKREEERGTTESSVRVDSTVVTSTSVVYGEKSKRSNNEDNDA